MKNLRNNAQGIVLVFLLVSFSVLTLSCEAVFTYSPLTAIPGVARELTDLSAPQQASYARDLLASGADSETLLQAYEIIAEAAGEDPELNLLAADLALGASGINSVVNTVLNQIGTGEEIDLEAALETIDLEIVVQAGNHIVTAVSGETTVSVSSTQYIVAGAALIFAALEEEEITDYSDLENDLGENASYQQAIEFFENADYDITSLSSLFF